MKQQYECLGFKLDLLETTRPIEWRGGESGVVIVQLIRGAEGVYHARMTAYVSQQRVEVFSRGNPEEALAELEKKVRDHARYVQWLQQLTAP